MLGIQVTFKFARFHRIILKNFGAY